MDYARDVLAQKDVRADRVSERARDRYYVCPVCRKEVEHRQGRFISSYFAHRRGQGTRECNLYFPSDGLGGGIGVTYSLAERTQSEENEYSGVELFFKNAESRNWFFYLRLPRSDSDIGFVRIDLGLDDNRKIPLSTLSRSFKRFAFVPSSPKVGIQFFSGDVSASYRAKASPAQASLNWDGITAFHANQIHNRHTRAARLYWGMEYFFAYRSALGLTLPAGLTPAMHPTKYGWMLARVTLPEREDGSIEQWIAAHSDIPFGTRAAKLFLLSPAAKQLRFRNTVNIGDAGSLLLNLHRDAFSADAATLWVETESGPVSLHVNDVNNELVKVNVRDSDRHVYIRYGSDPGALVFIERSVRTDAKAAASVTLYFEDVATGSRESAPLFSILCHNKLKACRQGSKRIVDLKSQGTWSGQLRVKERDRIYWQQANIVVAEGRRTNRPLVERINAILKRPRLDCSIEINCGISQYVAARKSPAKSAFVPSDKLKWLLTQYPQCWDVLLAQPPSLKAIVETLSRLKVSAVHEIHKAYLLSELLTQYGGVGA